MDKEFFNRVDTKLEFIAKHLVMLLLLYPTLPELREIVAPHIEKVSSAAIKYIDDFGTSPPAEVHHIPSTPPIDLESLKPIQLTKEDIGKFAQVKSHLALNTPNNKLKYGDRLIVRIISFSNDLSSPGSQLIIGELVEINLEGGLTVTNTLEIYVTKQLLYLLDDVDTNSNSK